MTGMGASTGRPLGGVAHLRQSIRDILTTPIGTRVMRRDYGSRLFELVDAPMTPSTLVAIYAETADALARWEPRLIVRRVRAQSATPGHVELALDGVYVPTGEPLTLEGIIV